MPEADVRAVAGRIFEVQRFSIHDGPGIRTTVFMQGCPLSCIWCHNPESIGLQPRLSFIESKCIGCGYCLRVCPKGAHRRVDGRHVLDRSVCAVCGSCTQECDVHALELAGRETTVGAVIDEVLRDRPFYETSQGGLTLSGGEPTHQIAFAEALLQAGKAAGLHCCVETTGHADYERLERIRPYVDLFLYDFKESDPARHTQYTGVSNDRILANLRRLHREGAQILLRCPVIPGYNDRADHFDAIAALAAELPGLIGVELMPYNPLGESKVERFALDPSRRAQSATPAPATVAQWIATLRDKGVPVLTQ